MQNKTARETGKRGRGPDALHRPGPAHSQRPSHRPGGADSALQPQASRRVHTARAPLLTPGAAAAVSRRPPPSPPRGPRSRPAELGAAGRPAPPRARLRRRAAVLGSRPARRAPPGRAVRMLPSPTHSRGTVPQLHSHFAPEEPGNGSAESPRTTGYRHLCKLGAQNALLLIGCLL